MSEVAGEQQSQDERSGGTSAAADMQARFRDASEKLKSRADLTAKAVGGVGSIVLAAVGLSKLGDAFPLPTNDWEAVVAVVLLFVSFVVMAAVLAFFTLRLWRLNTPLILSSDPSEMSDLQGQSELDDVTKIYKQTADLNRVPSLAAYEERAHRLQRIAEHTDDAMARRYRAEAAEIVSEVLATEARAGAVVIRRRAGNAIRGRWAFIMYCLFVVAVLVFAGSADALDSKRSGEIAVAKSCADARKAGVMNLPGICTQYDIDVENGDIGGGGETATPAEEAGATLESVAAAYVRCRVAATKAKTGFEECELIRAALLQLAATPPVPQGS